MKAAQIADLKRRWREQQDDVLFPDEVTVHSLSALWQLSVLRSVLCLNAPGRTTLICQLSTEDGLIKNCSTDGHASGHSSTDALCQIPRPAKLALQPLGP